MYERDDKPVCHGIRRSAMDVAIGTRVAAATDAVWNRCSVPIQSQTRTASAAAIVVARRTDANRAAADAVAPTRIRQLVLD